MPEEFEFGWLYSENEEYIHDCPSGGMHVWKGCKNPFQHEISIPMRIDHRFTGVKFYKCKKCGNYLYSEE